MAGSGIHCSREKGREGKAGLAQLGRCKRDKQRYTTDTRQATMVMVNARWEEGIGLARLGHLGVQTEALTKAGRQGNQRRTEDLMVPQSEAMERAVER